MDPPYSNFYLSSEILKIIQILNTIKTLGFFQIQIKFLSLKNLRTSQNTEKQPRGTKWDAAEYVALMLAWCLASENSVNGKKKQSLWTKIKKIYD
ncbi:hypothetical protein HanRHA438_Chr04g0166481 [Helianthus annuus]|nr:hypothetical protein HanRHA438_Chr04g0166481 [Helianthus annuus]